MTSEIKAADAEAIYTTGIPQRAQAQMSKAIWDKTASSFLASGIVRAEPNDRAIPELLGTRYLSGAETLFKDTPALEVFQAHADEGAPVTWTDMMKLGHSIQFAVIANNHAITKIGCCCCTQG